MKGLDIPPGGIYKSMDGGLWRVVGEPNQYDAVDRMYITYLEPIPKAEEMSKGGLSDEEYDRWLEEDQKED